MRLLAAISLLVLSALALHAPVDAQAGAPKGMGALDILDALNSHDAAMRDRAAGELKRMDARIAEDLGKEIKRAGVREAETVLIALGVSDCANAALTACVVLDSEEKSIRIAAMDALITISPIKVSEGGSKQLTAKRLEIIRKLVVESDYVKQLCESANEDDKGTLVAPVGRLLSLTILLDRFYGVGGMPMLVKRISEYMLGEQPDDDKPKTTTQHSTDERLRREAEACCRAVWISDPAIQFNYAATAPFEDRQKAVARLIMATEKMQKAEVTFDHGAVKYTGQRYGDHLESLYSSSDVNEVKAAAYLRFQWWMGEDVPIAGEGYAEAVDKVNSMNRRARSELRSKLGKWWQEYRAKTELK